MFWRPKYQDLPQGNCKRKKRMSFFSLAHALPRWRSKDYTDKKENQIFLIYNDIQSGAVTKSCMRKGFLIYEEMCKYFPIHEEAVSHIWLCNCSILNFLTYFNQCRLFRMLSLQGLLRDMRVILAEDVNSTLQELAARAKCAVVPQLQPAALCCSSCGGGRVLSQGCSEGCLKGRGQDGRGAARRAMELASLAA